MHAYRTHTCGDLRAAHVGEEVRLSGWVHRKRDHGDLVFVDLRDHYGITQIVTEADGPAFAVIESLRSESVVTMTGTVVARAADVVNPNLPTGEVEVRVTEAWCSRRRRSCRCRCSGMPNIPRTSACAIASSTSGASGSTGTSCSAATSSRRCASG